MRRNVQHPKPAPHRDPGEVRPRHAGLPDTPQLRHRLPQRPFHREPVHPENRRHQARARVAHPRCQLPRLPLEETCRPAPARNARTRRHGRCQAQRRLLRRQVLRRIPLQHPGRGPRRHLQPEQDAGAPAMARPERHDAQALQRQDHHRKRIQMITANGIIKVIKTTAKAAYCVAFVALAITVLYMVATSL